MKSLFSPLSLGASLALFLSVTLTPAAQDQPAQTKAQEVETQKSPPRAADTLPTDAASAAQVPDAAPPVAAEPESPPLRDLTVPTEDAVKSRVDAIRERADEIRRRADEMKQRARTRAEEERVRRQEMAARHTGYDVVNVFADSFLPPGEKADNVVAIFGNATSEGEAVESVVTVFGNNRVTGPAGDSVVAVFGNTTVNSHVRNVVAVFGDVELGPKAEVDEEVVCIAGSVNRDPGAVVHHHVKNIGRNFAFGQGLKQWFTECLLKGRPLAFESGLGWAWTIALSLLAFYVFIALLFRGGLETCTRTLEARPGASILTAICTVILSPVVIVLLCVTVVGVAVVPFLGMGLLIASLFGKAVMLGWLGCRLTKFFGDGPLSHPAFAVLVGGLIVLGIYTVPVLGFLTYNLLGWVGLGTVVYTLLLAFRREKPAVSPVVAGPSLAAPAMIMADPVPTLPSTLSAMTMPRAGFWIRLIALAIDGIVVSVVCSFLTGFLPYHGHVHLRADLLPSLALYGALLWKLRGTTVGGIVCNLKVVRIDGREIDWGTAIVRALGCFLSLIVAGLGFIWVAIDDDKQSWHDKIAGTTVVRVPKGRSLL
jgi:uncharacterized RDD family membrane protein YckC